MAAAIPNDLLISEVLTRLPVKSLLRLRSVCRSWLNAVADPAFVRRHLELSSSRAANPPTSVLAVHTRVVDDPDDAAAPEDVITFHRVRRHYSSGLDAPGGVVVELMQEEALHCADAARVRTSHCNGLVAVAVKVGKVFVSNPATKEFFVLPPGSRSQRDHRNEETAALGFDPCTGRYVLARCLYRRYDLHTDEFTGEQSLDYDILHEVFTLGASGSGDWEITETPPCPIDDSVLPACVQGAFYWAANNQSNETERKLSNALLRFDIHNGKFVVVPLPPCVAFMDRDHRDSLTELDGELYYACPNTKTAFDFWVLLADEHKEVERFRWSLRWRVNFGVPIGVIVPISVAPDGALILYEDTEDVIYRLDERNPVLERVVDVNEVYWDLVDQLGVGDYDYPEQCGNSGDYDCQGCGGGNDNGDEVVELVRISNDDGVEQWDDGSGNHDDGYDYEQYGDEDCDCEQCGGGGDEYDSEQYGIGDDDGDKVIETLGGSDDYGVEQWDYESDYMSDYDDAEEWDQDDPALPKLRSLFMYVESLVQIN